MPGFDQILALECDCVLELRKSFGEIFVADVPLDAYIRHQPSASIPGSLVRYVPGTIRGDPASPSETGRSGRDRYAN